MERTLNIETKEYIGNKVRVCGWAHSIRSHGKILFFDLRDVSGFLQIVFTPSLKKIYELALQVRTEWVLEVCGKVAERPKNMVNPKIPTGEIELQAESLKIISKAKTLPFEIDKDTFKVKEGARLKYRYLDLRTERMRNILYCRHKAILFIRNYLEKRGFIEIQTPILSKSTPEGARDYLVPSRLHKGKFFALPQSPQQYKQLLMVAGIEKYFQIAPCFRDEDARSDRSPGDFYQLDIEMSFVEQNDILNLVEKLFIAMIEKIFPEKYFTQKPWPRLKYQEVMEKYKTDKPDLRKNENDKDELAFAWIIDFPLFVHQTKEDFFHGSGKAKFAPSHHMFTAPKKEDIHFLESDPLKARSEQHDLVLNGYEVGGGSIRIHDPEIQKKVFDLIGFTKKQKEQFNHLLEAFEYGVPPHGGIAPGLDRLFMILLSQPNLREVIAFPLTGDGKDLLMGAPSEASKEQLKELGIKIIKNKK